MRSLSAHRGRSRAAVHGHGHGHRHRPGQTNRDLRGVPAGGQLHDAQVWRNRPGPDDFVAAGRADGRANLGGERARQGQPFPFHGEFRVQKAATRTVVPRDPETLRDMRVLVVDDNATNRQILVKMLENWRMMPTAADSGAKAIVTLTRSQGDRPHVSADPAGCADAGDGRVRGGGVHQAEPELAGRRPS